ncbi:MAG: hypothetical protein HGA61_02220 [Candidatus Moranbacteria bacterium]|nr:hypothetical protein [Candidatus Moranbacteria bacterium]
MKKNMRNALAISGIAIVLGMSSMVFDANAGTLKEGLCKYKKDFKGKNLSKNQRFQRHRKSISASVVSVSDNFLTATRGSKTFTIKTSEHTRLFDKDWKRIKITDIKNGDKIKVSGTLSELSITARTIRDISL